MDDLHVQHAQEADPEAEAQGVGAFRLVEQRGVVERQLGERVAEVLVVVGVDREHAGVDLRLDLLEAGQHFHVRRLGVGQGVAHRRAVDVLDGGAHPAHLAGFQDVGLFALGGEHAQAVDHVVLAGGFDVDLVALLEAAVTDPHQRDHAHVVVEPGIDDQRLQPRVALARRRRNALHQLLEQVVHAQAGLGRHMAGVGGVQADDLLDLLGDPVRFRLRQIHLVEHRQHLQVLLDGGVAVAHRLRFHALGGVHHQQRALAGGQGAGHLVGEVHVAGRVDEVELVGLTVTGGVVERHALRLDGDAAFALQIHGIQHLLLELAVGQPAANLNEAVRQGGFAVINVRDDGEIANVRNVGHVYPPEPEMKEDTMERDSSGLGRQWIILCERPVGAGPLPQPR